MKNILKLLYFSNFSCKQVVIKRNRERTLEFHKFYRHFKLFANEMHIYDKIWRGF